MYEFKVGDRVEVVKDAYCPWRGAFIQYTGEVVDFNGIYIAVLLDHTAYDEPLGFLHEELSLVGPAEFVIQENSWGKMIQIPGVNASRWIMK